MIELCNTDVFDNISQISDFIDAITNKSDRCVKYSICDERVSRNIGKVIQSPETVLLERPDIDLGRFHRHTPCLRRTEIVALPRGIFSPSTHAVISGDGEFYRDSLDYTIPHNTLFSNFAQFDKIFHNLDGNITTDISEVPYMDEIAIPVCGPGVFNFGHFLYDGLPLCFALTRLMPAGSFCLIGSPLRDWQRTVLAELDLLQFYRPIEQSTRFRTIIASSFLYGHIPAPTRFLRGMFDHMAFKNPARGNDALVYLSRPAEDKRRILNTASFEAALQGAGFLIVSPAELPLGEMISTMASARLVVGQGGAGMANVGFCHPGTLIAEIQGSAFLDPWTRSMCAVLGLDWYMYVADNSGMDVHASYEIDIERCFEFIETLKTKASFINY